MRIAFVTPEYVSEENFDGGLSGYLERTARGLVALGQCCVVIVGSDRSERIIRDGVEIQRVAVRPRWLYVAERLLGYSVPLAWLWQSWRLNRKLAEIAGAQPFDVVQYASYTGTALFRRGKTPAVVRISSVQQLLHAADGAAHNLRRWLYEWIESLALAKADALFAPSRLIAGRVAARTGRAVAVVESPWTPATYDLDDALYRAALAGKRYLLYFGTLSALKGLAALADALPRLLARYPDLHFVAAGKEQLFQGRGMMEHVRAAAGSAAARILYLGKLPRPVLLPVVANATAVVLPSRMDNLPNTCIEAMGLGRVVVATRGASFEQLISNAENGFLCERDDPDDLLRVLTEVLALESGVLRMIGQRASLSIERLRPELVLPELLRMYENVSADLGCGVTRACGN